jgi:integrase
VVCGNQDWLYAGGRCARCVLAGRLDRLLGQQAHRRPRGLEPLAQALLGAKRPEAVLGWLRGNRPATSILARLGSGALACSHEVFDELAATTRTAAFIDDLLTTLGTLPARDSQLDRLDRQVHQLLGSIGDPGQQRLLRRWATWAILRRHRATSQHTPLTAASRRNATASLRAAAHLLAWLDARGQTLSGCAQPDLDAYLLQQPSHRSLLGGFLTWAHQHRAAPRLACTRPARPISAIPADQDERWALARRLLHQPGPSIADRVAALLIVLFAQRPSRISQLATSDITIDGNQVHLHLGSSPVQVPQPLAGHLRKLLATRTAPTQAHLADPGPWLFPGMHAGQPAAPVTISRRVRRLGVDRSHRAGALLQLCGQLPAPVVADLLGLSTQTALGWTRLAGRPWADYPELRLATGRAGVDEI